VHRLGYGPFSRCTTDAAGPRRRLCLTALEAVALACEAVGMAGRACPVPCSCSGRTTCCARSCCPALEAARFARKAVGMARRARPVPSTNLRCVQGVFRASVDVRGRGVTRSTVRVIIRFGATFAPHKTSQGLGTTIVGRVRRPWSHTVPHLVESTSAAVAHASRWRSRATLPGTTIVVTIVTVSVAFVVASRSLDPTVVG
jgi:hypothetical protein